MKQSKKSSSKRSHARAPVWTEWEYSPEHGNYYRYGIIDGEERIDWYPVEPDIPRAEPELAQGMEALALGNESAGRSSSVEVEEDTHYTLSAGTSALAGSVVAGSEEDSVEASASAPGLAPMLPAELSDAEEEEEDEDDNEEEQDDDADQGKHPIPTHQVSHTASSSSGPKKKGKDKDNGRKSSKGSKPSSKSGSKGSKSSKSSKSKKPQVFRSPEEPFQSPVAGDVTHEQQQTPDEYSTHNLSNEWGPEKPDKGKGDAPEFDDDQGGEDVPQMYGALGEDAKVGGSAQEIPEWDAAGHGQPSDEGYADFVAENTGSAKTRRSSMRRRRDSQARPRGVKFAEQDEDAQDVRGVEEEEEEEEEDDPELRQAMHESMNMAYKRPVDEEYPDGYNHGASSSGAQDDYERRDDDEDDGGQDASAKFADTDQDVNMAYLPPPMVGMDITGTEGDFEPLDPRYKVEYSHRWEPGAVFKVLWSEPLGHKPGNQKVRNQIFTDVVKMKDFYVGFRRFIIVATDLGHSQCVPILTYEHRGCTKSGVKPEKHGIIYSGSTSPSPLRREPELGFPPVRMVVDAPGEKLDHTSRVNYAKIQSVEHNVKVFFIGHIPDPDFEMVSLAVNDCWGKKQLHKTDKRHRSNRHR